jgi:putative N6-adenine-specific DNA methylase
VLGYDSRPGPLVATCTRGLEEVLADELRALGVDAVAPGRGMVSCTGDLATVYDANLRLRTAMRVLVPMARGQVRQRKELYDLAASVAWERILQRGQTMAVEVAGSSRFFRNTVFSAQVVKDAVVDRLRSHWGARPDVDRQDADVRLHLHLSEGASSLALDSTGEPLSHRGYRPAGGPAPLAETLAAGVLLLAGYDGSLPLLDPLCGTGTLAVEAALIATGTAPGLRREFAFERWNVHHRELFEEVTRRASSGRHDPAAAIVARDRDERAVHATRRNLAAAWMDRFVTVEQSDALDLRWHDGVIVTNPPYGKRVGDVSRLEGFYRRLGDRLKRHAVGSTAWLLVGNPQLAKRIGLRPRRRIPLYNGPIECRLLRFDLYEGSTEQRKQSVDSDSEPRQ